MRWTNSASSACCRAFARSASARDASSVAPCRSASNRSRNDPAAYRFGGGVGKPLEQVLQTMRDGDVVVMDLGGSDRAAAWGGLASRIAQRRGVRGTIMWGACRDVEEIRAIGYPVWSVATCPRRSRNEFTFGWINKPVTIADVTIAPRDFIVADESGVLCVPHARLDEVLGLAAKIDAQEAHARGADPQRFAVVVGRRLDDCAVRSLHRSRQLLRQGCPMSFDPAATGASASANCRSRNLASAARPSAASRRRIPTSRSSVRFAQLHGAGLRYFDVAPFYGSGPAEHRLGACLRRVDRRELVLSTKIGRLLRSVARRDRCRRQHAAAIRSRSRSTTATTARCARSSTACSASAPTRSTSCSSTTSTAAGKATWSSSATRRRWKARIARSRTCARPAPSRRSAWASTTGASSSASRAMATSTASCSPVATRCSTTRRLPRFCRTASAAASRC